MTVSTKMFPLEYLVTRSAKYKASLAVNMLLFIAPVSAFNQTLTEDRSVNRLVRSSVSSS